MVGEGGEARSATDYGRPDRHERQCERDWGFETQHRHSSRSVTTARQQETRSRESGCSTTHSPMTTPTTTISGRVEGAGENIFIFTLHD